MKSVSVTGTPATDNKWSPAWTPASSADDPGATCDTRTPAESFSAETPSVGVRTVSIVARNPASGSSVFHGYGSRPSTYLALKSANDLPPAAVLTEAHHCASVNPVP